ncbi:MAG: response regulator [Nitrospira sp. CG24C]|jgi:DNA-binding NtrC family response regulator|nr:MAG: response regulator [Nitrospira sp. CG24C]TKB52553.1 MAG: response regulator [Nitrospira sp.]
MAFELVLLLIRNGGKDFMGVVSAINSARKDTILLVDDESAITIIFEMELARIGYCVLIANNAQQAKQVAAEFPSTIDALVTDWKMPDMMGDQLVSDLLIQRPGLKVVMMSGSPEAETASHAFHKDQLTFLQKPFGIAELNQAIRLLLGPSNKYSSQVA